VSPTLRVAVTLEQCWHDVPGGTASSALETVAALGRRPDVSVVGVAARHDAMPRPPWTPTVPVSCLPLPRIALYEAWQLPDPLRWPRVQQATGPVDVIHATTSAIPPKSAPLVVTVHDLAFLYEPSHFTRHGLRFFNRGLALTRTSADLVLVPSRVTYDDCLSAGIEESRLRLVPHGVSVPSVSAAVVSDFRDRYGVPARYVMWCGTLEPRKNVPALVAAYARLRRADPTLGLVLVGPSGWGDVEVGSAAGVQLLGFLPTAELHAAYAGASAFCYPSSREGFGLPVLEAMAHGVPVVTSAGSSMAEFVDGAGLLVDPTDIDALAAALLTALSDDPSGETSLGALARARAARYSWDAAAELTVAAYREAMSR
jgi:glycosyltransferase involved in cell wall biosynthesis